MILILHRPDHTGESLETYTGAVINYSSREAPVCFSYHVLGGGLPVFTLIGWRDANARGQIGWFVRTLTPAVVDAHKFIERFWLGSVR